MTNLVAVTPAKPRKATRDAMAMMPERKLSSFDQIVIGARVSKSGQPVPASGDLQGLSQPVPSKSTPAQAIEIRDIVW